MKQLRLLSLTIVLSLLSAGYCASAWRDIPLTEVRAAFDRPVPAHPRLFMTDAQLADIKARLKADLALHGFYQAMLDKADDIIPQEPVKSVKTGRRLLS